MRISKNLAVLTGAGVSQESGLRTFRDAQTGLWEQYKPHELASPETFQRDPKLVWDWYAWRREAVKGVRPNPGHYALVAMEKHIPDFTLITQNVDGLHRMAGSQNVLELHGNIQRVRCADCYTFTEIWDDDTESVPRCKVCGDCCVRMWSGLANRCRVTSWRQLVQAARSCDMFFSIGTSGVVQPAASLGFAAHNRGAIVVEINAEPTPLTPKANYSFSLANQVEILPGLVKEVWG